MSEENTEVTTEEAANAEAVAAEEAFEAGFTGKPLKDAGPANPEVPDTTTETETETGSEDQPPADPPAVLAGLSEDQIKVLLAKASEVDSLKEELTTTRDKLFGRFGELNRTIQQLQDAKPDQQPAATAAGTRITADKLKRLSEEYPEIAEILAEDLSDVLSAPAPQEPVDIDARLKSHADEVSHTVNERLADQMMTYLRRDWREVIASPEFALYRSQEMKPEDGEQFDTSWDPFYIDGEIKKFDEWKGKQNKQAEKTSRLENAVQPRGTTTDHAPSDTDAFEAGFRAVRGVNL